MYLYVRLCDLDGHSVREMQDLQDGKEYVAVGIKKFQRLRYGSQNKVSVSLPKM